MAIRQAPMSLFKRSYSTASVKRQVNRDVVANDPLNILIRWEERALRAYDRQNLFPDPVSEAEFIDEYITLHI